MPERIRQKLHLAAPKVRGRNNGSTLHSRSRPPRASVGLTMYSFYSEPQIVELEACASNRHFQFEGKTLWPTGGTQASFCDAANLERRQRLPDGPLDNVSNEIRGLPKPIVRESRSPNVRRSEKSRKKACLALLSSLYSSRHIIRWMEKDLASVHAPLWQEHLSPPGYPPGIGSHLVPYSTMKSLAFALPVVLTFVHAVLGATYKQTDSHQGIGFLKSFSHQAISDPTHGRVEYVDQATALSENLTYAFSNTFIIRADHKTKLSANGPGRKSVRIQSHKKYLNHVAVFNIRHMPEGCATWPAVWEVGDDWPNQGEVDIVEGVNNISPNQATLHTAAGKHFSRIFFSELCLLIQMTPRVHNAQHQPPDGRESGSGQL
ncbi:hypothetical protein NM688_g8650 [Phlebia brevispora]|uniref:Uncharacterized protein n=1 Tax=Phlebia brevispora TaxID=194682 RepID=A0ACC1RSV1_9APHY|nr:hypothetical protein NM688_g8650 [Phlebia brevispora]